MPCNACQDLVQSMLLQIERLSHVKEAKYLPSEQRARDRDQATDVSAMPPLLSALFAIQLQGKDEFFARIEI